ncbi:hypothetical protein K491DRAFT_515778 [Lophiostoma macrostomum CBS 122681]|uniref:Uncharacterized protein n=1 Tax=Lophiostoma macrostomum CBS 122681 TaxID=1314788 RepID=A0A6A6T0D5_9PLEO|nr:hypothetical protein K491DRAFT_515778 [Lophiostoma macrostomum CBS 122681]
MPGPPMDARSVDDPFKETGQEANLASKNYRVKFAASLSSSLWSWSEQGCSKLPTHVEKVQRRLLDFGRMPGDEYFRWDPPPIAGHGLGSASLGVDYLLQYWTVTSSTKTKLGQQALATSEWIDFYYDQVLKPYIVRCRQSSPSASCQHLHSTLIEFAL